MSSCTRVEGAVIRQQYAASSELPVQAAVGLRQPLRASVEDIRISTAKIHSGGVLEEVQAFLLRMRRSQEESFPFIISNVFR